MTFLGALLQFGMSAHPAEGQTAGGAQTGAVEIRVGSTGQRRSLFALSPIDALTWPSWPSSCHDGWGSWHPRVRSN